MSQTIRAPSGDGTLSSAISDAMVRLLSRYTGRGATSSWTILGRDVIICVMGDALTKGERSLVQHGKREAALEIRKAFQESMAKDLIGVVEELSGRQVAAFVSNNNIDPDLAVEISVLEPLAGER
jgi:uncharacterized protein YbcI